MHVAVVGAGAIGAVLADAALRAGHDVSVCVRRAIPALTLDGEALEVTVLDDPSGAHAADLTFLTVKATDTAGAAPWMRALAGEGSLVAVVQNGLDQEERVRPYLPSGAEVAAVLAYVAAERVGAGDVRYFDGRTLIVPAAHREAIEAAVGPTLEVHGRADMVTAGWQKLLGNLIANPLTALTMRRIDVVAEPAVAELARGLLHEAVTVARAEGADIDEDIIEVMVVGTGQFGAATGSSMLYDRLAGRPLEHQFLTGEVVRRAATHGIPVPLNTAVLALLDALDRPFREGTGVMSG